MKSLLFSLEEKHIKRERFTSLFRLYADCCLPYLETLIIKSKLKKIVRNNDLKSGVVFIKEMSRTNTSEAFPFSLMLGKRVFLARICFRRVLWKTPALSTPLNNILVTSVCFQNR